MSVVQTEGALLVASDARTELMTCCNSAVNVGISIEIDGSDKGLSSIGGLVAESWPQTNLASHTPVHGSYE